jgi:outer membrane receptor protein involved in Fe transport
MIKLEVGQFNTLRIMGVYNLLGEKISQSGKNAFVALEYFMTDGPFDHPQNLNRINLFAKYSQLVDQNNKFSITASLYNSKWDQSGQLPKSAIDDGFVGRWGSLDPSEGGNTSRNNLSVDFMHQMKNEGIFKSLLYYTNYTFDLYSNFTFYLNDRINGDQIRQSEERNLYGYKGSYVKYYNIKDASGIKMEIGGGFRYDEILNSQLLHTKERYEILGVSNFGDIYELNTNLFGQATWRKNNWIVNFGLRLDAFKFEYIDKTKASYQPQDKYQNIVSPKINVSYNFSNSLQVYAKFGKGFHSNDARVVVQNDSILSLPAAYGADLGLNWKPIANLFINAAPWYMMLQEELVWSGDAGTWEPSGRTQRLGIDLSIRWQIMRTLFFDTDLNYSDARFMDEPEGMNYVPLAPIFTSTGGIKYIQEKGWSTALRYRYMSERPADESYSVATIPYLVFDYNLNYEYKRWVFGISVENLFNTEWNEAQFASDYRISPTAKAEYGLTYTPGIPFFFKSNLIFHI